MSSGETASVIHYDADHNLHCLLAGRKDFVMIDPIYYEELYMVEKVSSCRDSVLRAIEGISRDECFNTF